MTSTAKPVSSSLFRPAVLAGCSAAVGAVVALIGAAVLAGWWTGSEMLQTFGGGLPMYTGAAVTLVLLGSATAAAWLPTLPARLGVGAGAVAAAMAVRSLAWHFMGNVRVVDEPGGMTLLAAVILLHASAAVILASLRRNRANVLACCLAAVAFVLSSTLLGYYSLFQAGLVPVDLLLGVPLLTASAMPVLCLAVGIGAWARTDFGSSHPASLSLRRLALTASILSCAAMTAGWGYLSWRQYQDSYADASARTAGTVRVLEEHALRSLDPAYLAVQRTVDLAVERGIEDLAGSREEWRRLVRAISDLPQVSSLGILDREGRLRLFSLDFPAPAIQAANRSFFLVHRDGLENNFHIGEPFETKLTGRKVFSISKAVRGADNEFLGVVFASIDIEYFKRFYRELLPGPGRILGLYKVSGEVLVRQSEDGESHGDSVRGSALLTQRLPQAGSGTYVGASPLDGVDRVVSYGRTGPLVLLAGLPAREIVQVWQKGIVNASMLLSILFLAVGCFNILTRRSILATEASRLAELEAHRFGQAVLDSVTWHVSIVDRSGSIVETNAAWEAFARMNGLPVPSVGLNYFEVCRAVTGDDAPEALAALAGIEGVLGGSLREYTQIYSCHAPGERRWFNMRVVPLTGSEGLVVVSHENITPLKEAEESLRHLSETDVLTGIRNRRSFIRLAESELERTRRHGRELSLLLFDIDRFKRINDTYGHEAGDLVLKTLAETSARQLRTIDVIARVGGEEFCVLLPETSPDSAVAAAERLRLAVEATPAVHDGQALPVTVSVGVAGFGQECTDLSSLMRAADKALYEAKRLGRNRVLLAADLAA